MQNRVCGACLPGLPGQGCLAWLGLAGWLGCLAALAHCAGRLRGLGGGSGWLAGRRGLSGWLRWPGFGGFAGVGWLAGLASSQHCVMAFVGWAGISPAWVVMGWSRGQTWLVGFSVW